jgi:ArsR family transcriptional regulator
MTDVLDRLNEKVGAEADSRFYADILAAIARGKRTPGEMNGDVDAPPEAIESALGTLAERGLVVERNGRWRLR